MAAGHSVDPAGMFDELMGRIAGRFARVEPRRTARALVQGLLSPTERKTCWSLAEQAGHAGPQAMADWPEEISDVLRAAASPGKAMVGFDFPIGLPCA